MSGGGGDTTTVTKSDPWSGQQPYLQEVFAEAQKQYRNPNLPKYYPGQVTAGFDPAQVAGQQSLLGAAQQAGGYAGNVTDAANFNLTAGRDPASNPFLQSAIKAATQPIYDRLQDAGGTLAAIRGSAVGNNAYSGTRKDIAEGLAVSRANRDAMDVGMQMANEGYLSGQEQATRTLALSPQIAGAQTSQAGMLDAVGTQRRDMTQQIIDDAIAKWNFEQNLPGQKLENYANIVQGNYGGQSQTTGPGPKSQPLLTAMGGAATGYVVSGMNPLGAVVGGMIGLLGGM